MDVIGGSRLYVSRQPVEPYQAEYPEPVFTASTQIHRPTNLPQPTLRPKQLLKIGGPLAGILSADYLFTSRGGGAATSWRGGRRITWQRG